MRYKGIKGRAWDALAGWVKRRDIERYGPYCYTCGQVVEGANAQAGHYIPVSWAGSNNTLSWDVAQIRVQCGRCNGAGQGMQEAFGKRLRQELGDEAVERFWKRRWKVDKVTDWQKIIDEYSGKN